jgi:hypothetical protein
MLEAGTGCDQVRGGGHAVASPRVFGWLGQAMRRGVHLDERRRAGPALRYGTRPLEILVADLRRLGREGVRLQQDARVSARAFHLHATALAYDDTLILAAEALGVDTSTARPPLTGMQRLDLEVELTRAGLRW